MADVMSINVFYIRPRSGTFDCLVTRSIPQRDRRVFGDLQEPHGGAGGRAEAAFPSDGSGLGDVEQVGEDRLAAVEAVADGGDFPGGKSRGGCHEAMGPRSDFAGRVIGPLPHAGEQVGEAEFSEALKTGLDKLAARTYPVRVANLTLSIDKELLKRGRSYAQARGTSLNALVRKLLNEAISSPDAAVDAMIERLRQSAGDSKGVKIAREELHRY